MVAGWGPLLLSYYHQVLNMKTNHVIIIYTNWIVFQIGAEFKLNLDIYLVAVLHVHDFLKVKYIVQLSQFDQRGSDTKLLRQS